MKILFLKRDVTFTGKHSISCFFGIKKIIIATSKIPVETGTRTLPGTNLDDDFD